MNNPPRRRVTHLDHFPTILVVDEDDSLAQAVQTLLRAADFRVHIVSSAEAALRLFRKHADDITLILSDVELAGEDGLVLLTRVRTLAPRLPFCFMRSGDHKYTVAFLLEQGATKVFDKPLDWGHLGKDLFRLAQPRRHDRNVIPEDVQAVRP
jgi:DNA-binding response OmpR family regulator